MSKIKKKILIKYNMLFDDNLPVQEFNPIAGIYFLLDANYQVVYVGSSIDINTRVAVHLKQKKKKFSFYGIHQFDGVEAVNQLFEIEADYIAKYQPIYNRTMPESKWKHLKLNPTKRKKQLNKYTQFCSLNGVVFYNSKSKITNELFTT